MSTDAATHPDDGSLCHQIMDEQQATITGLQQRMQRLEHYVEQLLRSRYGPRSERIDPNQLQLFDQADADTTDSDASEGTLGDRTDNLSDLLPDEWLKKHPESRRCWSR